MKYVIYCHFHGKGIVQKIIQDLKKKIGKMVLSS